jgi:hypothetical protein
MSRLSSVARLDRMNRPDPAAHCGASKAHSSAVAGYREERRLPLHGTVNPSLRVAA